MHLSRKNIELNSFFQSCLEKKRKKVRELSAVDELISRFTESSIHSSRFQFQNVPENQSSQSRDFVHCQSTFTVYVLFRNDRPNFSSLSRLMIASVGSCSRNIRDISLLMGVPRWVNSGHREFTFKTFIHRIVSERGISAVAVYVVLVPCIFT